MTQGNNIQDMSNSGLVRSYSASPKRPFSSRGWTLASPESITGTVEMVLNYINNKQPWFFSHAKLQALTGCRVSEAFNPSLWNLANDWRYTLQPNKKNNTRTFPVEWSDRITTLLADIRAWAVSGISESNYRRVVRHAFRKVGLIHVSPNGYILAGCHTFRHAYVKRMMVYDCTWEELLRDTGEKTKKALEHYTDSQFYIANQPL